ncbi:MAG TPA: GNAT family N-acetyltransferase, partial [Anaerolineae bacterium]
GIGSAIVRRMTAVADWEHAGCYLESSKARNVPLYERHGFISGRQIAPLGVVHWLMWRPVR